MSALCHAMKKKLRCFICVFGMIGVSDHWWLTLVTKSDPERTLGDNLYPSAVEFRFRNLWKYHYLSKKTRLGNWKEILIESPHRFFSEELPMNYRDIIFLRQWFFFVSLQSLLCALYLPFLSLHLPLAFTDQIAGSRPGTPYIPLAADVRSSLRPAMPFHI